VAIVARELRPAIIELHPTTVGTTIASVVQPSCRTGTSRSPNGNRRERRPATIGTIVRLSRKRRPTTASSGPIEIAEETPSRAPSSHRRESAPAISQSPKGHRREHRLAIVVSSHRPCIVSISDRSWRAQRRAS